MWQKTTRRVIDSKVRVRAGRFRAMTGISWIVLIVVLTLVGVLAAMFLSTRLP